MSYVKLKLKNEILISFIKVELSIKSKKEKLKLSVINLIFADI